MKDSEQRLAPKYSTLNGLWISRTKSKNLRFQKDMKRLKYFICKLNKSRKKRLILLMTNSKKKLKNKRDY